MYHLETRIEINASAERVWSLLTDFPAYPQWNPFIPSIEGKAVVGQPPTVFILASGLPWHAIPPHGARRRAPARASMELLIPGLFDGEHYFKLEPKSGTARERAGRWISSLSYGSPKLEISAGEPCSARRRA